MMNNKKKFLISRKNLFLILGKMGYYKLVLEKEQYTLQYLNLYKYQTFIKTKLLILYLKKCKVKSRIPPRIRLFHFHISQTDNIRMLIYPDTQSLPEGSGRFR